MIASSLLKSKMDRDENTIPLILQSFYLSIFLLLGSQLAHLKEKNHDKAFYQLCCHMLPDYHQLEFDTRLWLTARELER